MTWLELLSNVDTMVLGSIVGSIVMGFLLVVVIFSLRIKSLHELIRSLRSSLEEQTLELDRQQENLIENTRQMADAQTIMMHYQEVEEGLNTELKTLQVDQKKREAYVRKLREKITRLDAEKKALSVEAAQAQSDLKDAREEIQTVLKRNEFWVEQLSELRTKHDAIVLKLRRMETARL